MTLHIASGECAAASLKQKHPDYDILPFNEAMCEGNTCLPVFGEEFCRLRAEAYGVTMQEYMQKSPAQKLKSANSYAAVELYFDHDMFCAVNAVTLLAYLDATGFTGDIFFNLLRQDGSATILARHPISAEGYAHAYKEILVKHIPCKTGFELFDRVLPLFFEYKEEENDITRFARAHAGDGESACIRAMLEVFRDYGLTDLAALRILHKING